MNFGINVHIFYFLGVRCTGLFFACFLRLLPSPLFSFAAVKPSFLWMESVEGSNTSSWHDSDKFPGQTCGLEGICVLCGLEMGCLFPHLWRQAVATMEIIDSRTLDDS